MCVSQLSGLSYKLITYGWIVFASALFVTGTTMLIVSETHNSVSADIGVIGIMVMLGGGLLAMLWACWVYTYGCCEGDRYRAREPVYI